MTPDRHARVKELFLAAVELPRDERGPWLARECAEDPSLRREVEALLAQKTAEFSKPAGSMLPPTDFLRGADAVANPKPGVPGQFEAATTVTAPRRTPIDDSIQERPAGTVIAGRYRIVSRLGVGGMGIVYRAEDLTLNQNVAIKFLPSLVATKVAWLARFRNEARLARTVTHPNVCRVYDIGEADGENFITMEFVPGEDLSSLLRRIGRPSVEKAQDIARQVCAGLAAAHRAGVLHRDLKPANIMLDDEGNVRITDFGIAGLSGQISGGEIRAGTPAYMAPEQLAGRDVTVQSDIYALGLVLYELFSGGPAFHAASVEEYLQLHETATPPALSEVAADLPEGIEAVVNQCLEKEPERRPTSALHVAAALPGTDVLRLALASGVTPSPDLVAVAPARKGDSTYRWGLVIAGISLLAALGFLRSFHPVQWDDLGPSPPAALAERARRLLDAAGLALPNAREAYGYCVTEDAWEPLARAFAGADIAARVLAATPAEPCFFYRQSDRPLTAATLENVFWSNGNVAPNDPPLTGNDSRAVLFDKAGRLILLGLAADATTSKSSSGDADRKNQLWGGLFEAAGIDPAQADRTEAPESVARTAAGDECTFSSPDQPPPNSSVPRLVTCSKRGVPSFFALGSQPGERPQPTVSGTGVFARQQRAVATAQRTLFLLLLAVAIPVGIPRLRAARVDYQSAVRLAAVVVIVEVAAALLRLGNAGTLYAAVSRLAMTAVRAAGVAGLLGVFYLAVDVYARRHWPHLLVTWNRLLLGRFGDADVRFHILVGTCVGTWWAFAASAERAVVSALGWTPQPMFGGDRVAEKLSGFAAMLASCLGCVQQALIFGLLFLLLLVLLRSWIRNPAWAAVVCTLMLLPIVIPRGANPYSAALVMGLGGAAVCVWVMVRYGLLAIVISLFVSAILVTTPMNVLFRAWTVSISLCAILIVAFLMAFAVLRRGGHPSRPEYEATGTA